MTGVGKEDLHQQIVHEILYILKEESYFLCPSKCIFEQICIKYLGIIVDGEKLTVDPKKAAGLCDWPHTLNTVKEVHSVLGVLGYQCPFIPNFANIAHSLVVLTKKGQPFNWTQECCTALDTLINIILNYERLSELGEQSTMVMLHM